MTALVTAGITIRATPERVYEALIDWESQGTWIPLTTVRVTEGDGGVGSVVEAVTGVGPASFVDVMRVEALEPPYTIRVMHVGKLVRGPGVFRCVRRGDGATDLEWRERLELPGGRAGRLGWPLVRPGAEASLKWGLRRLARQLETTAW
ncbi:SRPBCC family protein [Longispora sp. K20-0274]|uniref:SRPBCC family protein n=1 Tax=Longispora sp. K20-0274 TaxID=3088255 RepID=UPI00399BA7A3